MYKMCSFLQVSSKGMKMVQTPDKSSSSVAAASKKRMLSSDNMKQFVPHRFVVICCLFIFPLCLLFISHNSSITCVTQGDAPNDDVVSCIVLLSSPDSDCPLYVHSYRDAYICCHCC